ncbi:MAG: hypothetical protein AAF903_07375 [Pseudomonadota bacterium]
MSEREPNNGDNLSYVGRLGALATGFGLIGLGAADAVFDPFPGPETALFTAGIALVAIGVTGKRSKKD